MRFLTKTLLFWYSVEMVSNFHGAISQRTVKISMPVVTGCGGEDEERSGVNVKAQSTA